ncbi:MAG: hypothetical protein AAFU60_00310 [Bacteroidota bacterium]
MNWETNSEDQLRDKLQEHEFAFSEEAWQRMSQLLATESIPSGQAQTDSATSTPDVDQKNKKPWILPLWMLFLALTSTILSLTLLSKPTTLLHTPVANIQTPLSKQKEIAVEESSNLKFLLSNTIEHTPPFLRNQPKKTTNNLTPVPLALAINQNNRSSSESPTQPGASTSTYPANLALNIHHSLNTPSVSLDPLPSKDQLALVSSPTTIIWKEVIDKKAVRKIQPFVFGGLAQTFLSNPQSSNSINPLMGFGLEWQTPRWGFGISAQGQYLTGIDWQSSFAQAEATPLGYNFASTEVITKKLAFAQLNTYLFWQLKPRHRLQAGIAVARLHILEESPSLETNQVTFFDESLGALSIDSNQPGIRNWDFGATLGYQFQLSPHWQAQLLYQQGLFDLTADNWFGNTRNDLRSNLQIQLRYDF